MHRVLALCLAALLTLGCTRESKTTPYSVREILKKELHWLKHDAAPTSAVIFEEVTTKKFIQFSGRELSVDLPHQTLDPQEMARADRVMAGLGIRKSSYSLGEGESRYIQTAFQKNLAGDETAAIAIAETVFTEVFLFRPTFAIRVIRVE